MRNSATLIDISVDGDSGKHYVRVINDMRYGNKKLKIIDYHKVVSDIRNKTPYAVSSTDVIKLISHDNLIEEVANAMFVVSKRSFDMRKNLQ